MMVAVAMPWFVLETASSAAKTGLSSAAVGVDVILVLNVYKPRGMTRYGWRKQDEQRRKQHV